MPATPGQHYKASWRVAGRGRERQQVLGRLVGFADQNKIRRNFLRLEFEPQLLWKGLEDRRTVWIAGIESPASGASKLSFIGSPSHCEVIESAETGLIHDRNTQDNGREVVDQLTNRHFLAGQRI